MAFAVFGPGALFLTRTDVPAQTPINVGYANEFSLDEAAETKELFGQFQYPLAVGRGTIKATGKMKAAYVSGQALNAFHGGSFTAGQLKASLGETAVIPAAGPFTVVGSHGSTFNGDLGVVYANSGLPLVSEAQASLVGAIGQYSSNAGTYTFDSLDGGAAVKLSYGYNDTTSGGQMQIVTNQLIGTSPTFQLDYVTVFQGKSYYLRIYQCISTKLMQAFKLGDFMLPELDISIFANAAGNVYAASYADVG